MIQHRAVGRGLAIILVLVAIACGSSDSASRTSTPAPTLANPASTPVPPSEVPTAPIPASATATITSSGATLPKSLPETAINDLITYLSVQPGSQPDLVHYATIDRPVDGIVRRMFISPAAIEAFATDDHLPASTIIMMEVYRAGRDTSGQLLTDAAGRLVPVALEKIVVRVDLAGVGQSSGRVPDGIRNGDWDYVTIEPARNEIGSVNNTSCHACHSFAEEWDYLFTYPKLTPFVETGEPQYDTCALVGRQPCALPGH